MMTYQVPKDRRHIPQRDTMTLAAAINKYVNKGSQRRFALLDSR